MTNEEVIRIAQGLMTDFKCESKTMVDFCNTIIKALEQEPCDDAINRDMALEKMADYVASGYADSAEDFEEYSRIICQLPPVTPEPKTGHWIKTPKAVMGEGYMWYCDKCEHQVYQDSSRPYPSERYCPNCGARMFEPQESEDKE